MTNRDDVEGLGSAHDRIIDWARRDLFALVSRLDLTSPEVVRDALLEIVPELVSEYGDLAAVAASEWYASIRPGAGYTAVLGDVSDEQAVRGSVRALAGGLWTDAPLDAVEQIAAAMKRHVLYSSRDTVARNVNRDPNRPRFARVPRGAETCAWCDMLASRGWVYHTRETAGEQAFNEFHDSCDCAIVPEWDADTSHIDGYDPDELYDRYLTARAELEAEGAPVTDAAVAARMELLFPDNYARAA